MMKTIMAVAMVVITSGLFAEDAPYKTIDITGHPLKSELIDALTKAIEDAGDEAGAGLYRKRAHLFANGGKWKEAAADLRQIVSKQPKSLNAYQQAAVALLLAGDRMQYQQLVEEFLAGQKDNEDKFSVEKQVKLCVLSTAPIGDADDLQQRIAKVVSQSDGADWAPYFPAAQAMTFYRFGKFKEALKAVAEADRRHALNGGSNQRLYARVRISEAMCHAKLGDMKKASSAFKKADDILRRRLVKPEFFNTEQYWHDWMIGKLLHDEACRVLNDAATKESAP